MKTTLQLIAAPTSMQPGGYVPEAYKSRVQASTSEAQINVTNKLTSNGNTWLVELSWQCPKPIENISEETDSFPDAAALMVPVIKDAPWITMGEDGKPVEAILWRADKQAPLKMDAQGLGTMTRSEAPKNWLVKSKWAAGRWTLNFELADWPALSAHGQIGVAIWLGANAERGGLKSISPGWLAVK